MFWEEQIVDGVLSYRTTPNGKWEQYSKVELTKMLDEARTTLSLYEMDAEVD